MPCWKIRKSQTQTNLNLLFFVSKALQPDSKNAEEIYSMLTEKSDILFGYIIPEYEILHTQSKDYIVNDIISLMQERGIEI